MFRISTLLTILLFGIIGANAATLTVTSTADAGLGTLRQAMDDAVINGTANDIVFAIPTSDPGYNLSTNRFTISLLSVLPQIQVSATTITNAQTQGITVSGNNSFGIFNLVDSAVVVITNLTISNGNATDGGGILMGASGTLTLNDCVISNNVASSNGGAVNVGTSGTLHINRTS